MKSFTQYNGYTEENTIIDRNNFMYLREETSMAKILQEKKEFIHFLVRQKNNLFACSSEERAY